MTEPPAATDRAATGRLHRSMPFSAELGLELLHEDASLVRARLHWRHELTSNDGVLHGGATMVLADTVGGRCAALNLPVTASGTATIESKTNFLRPVTSGFVEASARPLQVGRSVIVVETEVVDDVGRLVAKVIQTQAVLLRPPGSGAGSLSPPDPPEGTS